MHLEPLSSSAHTFQGTAWFMVGFTITLHSCCISLATSTLRLGCGSGCLFRVFQNLQPWVCGLCLGDKRPWCSRRIRTCTTPGAAPLRDSRAWHGLSTSPAKGTSLGLACERTAQCWGGAPLSRRARKPIESLISRTDSVRPARVFR